jgi:hypothetical protein
MLYKISFNSGKSFEDTTDIEIEASSTDEAVELALEKNPDLSGWNYYVTNS